MKIRQGMEWVRERAAAGVMGWGMKLGATSYNCACVRIAKELKKKLKNPRPKIHIPTVGEQYPEEGRDGGTDYVNISVPHILRGSSLKPHKERCGRTRLGNFSTHTDTHTHTPLYQCMSWMELHCWTGTRWTYATASSKRNRH